MSAAEAKIFEEQLEVLKREEAELAAKHILLEKELDLAVTARIKEVNAEYIRKRWYCGFPEYDSCFATEEENQRVWKAHAEWIAKSSDVRRLERREARRIAESVKRQAEADALKKQREAEEIAADLKHRKALDHLLAQTLVRAEARRIAESVKRQAEADALKKLRVAEGIAARIKFQLFHAALIAQILARKMRQMSDALTRVLESVALLTTSEYEQSTEEISVTEIDGNLFMDTGLTLLVASSFVDFDFTPMTPNWLEKTSKCILPERVLENVALLTTSEYEQSTEEISVTEIDVNSFMETGSTLRVASSFVDFDLTSMTLNPWEKTSKYLLPELEIFPMPLLVPSLSLPTNVYIVDMSGMLDVAQQSEEDPIKESRRRSTFYQEVESKKNAVLAIARFKFFCFIIWQVHTAQPTMMVFDPGGHSFDQSLLDALSHKRDQ
jgi:hypothetical protein